jgi:hypothetical protein
MKPEDKEAYRTARWEWATNSGGKDLGEYMFKAALAYRDAQQAVALNDKDELQPAANWIYNGLRPCEISDIQESLMLGFNRAKRLYDSAKAAAEAAKGVSDADF